MSTPLRLRAFLAGRRPAARRWPMMLPQSLHAAASRTRSRPPARWTAPPPTGAAPTRGPERPGSSARHQAAGRAPCLDGDRRRVHRGERARSEPLEEAVQRRPPRALRALQAGDGGRRGREAPRHARCAWPGEVRRVGSAAGDLRGRRPGGLRLVVEQLERGWSVATRGVGPDRRSASSGGPTPTRGPRRAPAHHELHRAPAQPGAERPGVSREPDGRPYDPLRPVQPSSPQRPTASTVLPVPWPSSVVACAKRRVGSAGARDRSIVDR